MSGTDALFSPYKLKNLSLPNRIAMAPMTRSFSPNQIPGANVAAYYRARVEGGVGLILTEGTVVDHQSASNDVNVPAFFGEAALAGWANVLKEVKAAGGFIMPQLWHQGTMRKPGTGPYPDAPSMGPSGLTKPGKQVAEPMTHKDIEDVIAAFAKSAKSAMDIGFDGVEIHGAHGYIVDQFFWDGTNARDDHFGGGLEERTRFAADIVKAVRAATRPDYPILLRFSQWKQQEFTARLAPTPQELETFLTPLAKAGVDMFHCSTRRLWEPEFPETGSEMNLAGWTKKISGVPTMTVGSVGLTGDFITNGFGQGAGVDDGADMNKLIKMLDRGDFDLVAVGRALIVNPDWANKVQQGKLNELKPWTPEALATLI
jgi:2,4-dienoyl-CoA reductase-like NADH-dependent reductase (Old Yellow Enzyme family)